MKKIIFLITIALIVFTTSGCNNEKEIDALEYIKQLNLEEPKSYKLVVKEYDSNNNNYINTIILIVDCTNTFCDYYTNKSNKDELIINQHYIYNYEESTYYSYIEATINNNHRKIKRKISSLPSIISPYNYETISSGLVGISNHYNSESYTMKKQIQKNDSIHISFAYNTENITSTFDYIIKQKQVLYFEYVENTINGNNIVINKKKFDASLEYGNNISKYNISDYIEA